MGFGDLIVLCALIVFWVAIFAAQGPLNSSSPATQSFQHINASVAELNTAAVNLTASGSTSGGATFLNSWQFGLGLAKFVLTMVGIVPDTVSALGELPAPITTIMVVILVILFSILAVAFFLGREIYSG